MKKGLRTKKKTKKPIEMGKTSELNRMKAASEGPRKSPSMRIELVSVTNKNWEKTVDEVYALMSMRLPSEEIIDIDRLKRYVKEVKNFALVIARNESGKVMGMASGSFHASAKTTYFYSHYIAVAKEAEKGGIASGFYEPMLLAGRQYTKQNGLPPVGFIVIEASKPHTKDEEAKLFLFAKLNAKLVCTNEKRIFPYYQPDLDDQTGKNPVRMGLLMADVNGDVGNISSEAVRDAIDLLYSAYEQLYGIDKKITDSLRANVFAHLNDGNMMAVNPREMKGMDYGDE